MHRQYTYNNYYHDCLFGIIILRCIMGVLAKILQSTKMLTALCMRLGGCYVPHVIFLMIN